MSMDSTSNVLVYMRAAHMLVALLLTCLASANAGASRPSAATTQVESSRKAYEKTLEEVRRSITAKLAAQSQTGALGLFRQQGFLESPCQFRQERRRYADAASRLILGYEQALEASRRVGDERAETGLQRELDNIRTHNDLVPWRTLIEPQPGPIRVKQDEPLTLDHSAEGAFRIEIALSEGWNAEPRHTIRVDLPLPNGERKIAVLTPLKGSRQIQLTIRGDAVLPDLGITRPIELADSHENLGRQIQISVSGIDFAVSEVRYKPIVEGAPEKRPDDAPPLEAEASPFWKGRRWRGEWGGLGCDIKITHRDQDLAFISIQRDNGALFQLEGRVKGGTFILEILRMIGGFRDLKRESGEIQIDKKGSLSASLTSLSNTNRVKNERFDIIIRHAQEREPVE